MATGINQSGDVVGHYYANAQGVSYVGPEGTPANLTEYLNQYGFRYSGGEFITLPTLGGAHTQALAINERDDIVGSSDLPAVEGQPEETHAILVPHDGRIVDLGTVAGHRSAAVAINSQGRIVGLSTAGSDPHDTSYHAFYHDGLTMA